VKTVNIHAPMVMGPGQDRRWPHEVTREVQSLSTGSPVGCPLIIEYCGAGHPVKASLLCLSWLTSEWLRSRPPGQDVAGQHLGHLYVNSGAGHPDM